MSAEPFKIGAIHAYIADNGDEGEGVIGAMMGIVFIPFVAADKQRLEALRPEAQRIANETGKPVKLIRLSVREDLETITPNGR